MADFRVLLFNQDGSPAGELSKDAGTLLSCTRSEEINGEHSLTLTTERHLEVGIRALTHHADGRWREWVVDEPSETHDTGEHAVGTYHLCWSLQYDLQTVYGNIQAVGSNPPTTYASSMPTYSNPNSGSLSNNYVLHNYSLDSYDVDWVRSTDAKTAMQCALNGSTMWDVGSCDVTSNARYVVMEADSSAWDRLTTVVKYWGGEIDVDIRVNANGVTSRMMCLYEHIGSKVANRRFEWGHDLTGITRTPDPGPYYCRVIPLGNGESEEMENDTTFNVPLTINTAATFVDSAKGIRHDRGTIYIRDTQSEAAFRKADGRGGWEYPTAVVTFSTDDVDELVEMAREDVPYHTRPGISYSGSVASFAKAGMDTDGIGLGDEVQVLDRGFNPDAELRVQERVLHIEIDEMGVDDARIDIGKLVPKLERTLATVAETVGVKAVSYNMPQWDSSPFEVETPNLSHYKVTTPSGGEYNVPSVSYDISDYGSAIADLQDQVSDLYGGGVVGSDSIVHQFNGVTMTSGTVNFTTSNGDETSGGGSSEGEGQGVFPKDASGWGSMIRGGVFDKDEGSVWGSSSGKSSGGSSGGGVFPSGG